MQQRRQQLRNKDTPLRDEEKRVKTESKYRDRAAERRTGREDEETNANSETMVERLHRSQHTGGESSDCRANCANVRKIHHFFRVYGMEN